MKPQRMVVGALVASAFWFATTCSSPAAVSSARSPSATLTSPPSLSPSPSIQIPPIPEGTYETDVTRKDAVRYGVTKCDPEDVDENTGHIELTFRSGRFRWVWSADHPIFHTLFTGVYTGDRHRVTLIFDANTADVTSDTLRWTFDGSALRFKLISSGDCPVGRMVYESHPWVKTA